MDAEVGLGDFEAYSTVEIAFFFEDALEDRNGVVARVPVPAPHILGQRLLLCFEYVGETGLEREVAGFQCEEEGLEFLVSLDSAADEPVDVDGVGNDQEIYPDLLHCGPGPALALLEFSNLEVQGCHDGPFSGMVAWLGLGSGGSSVDGSKGLGEGGKDVVFGGAGEEVNVDGLKGLGVDAGAEAEF